MATAKPGDRPRTAPSDLSILDRKLRRQRALAGRLWRSYQATDQEANSIPSTSAHQAWSDAIEEALVTAEAISRQQPTDLADLCIQFEATWWWVVEDDGILDGSARRWLQRFRRSLRRLGDSDLV